MLSTASTDIKIFHRESLTIKIFPTSFKMGAAAARDVAARIIELHNDRPTINIVFAAAPSQNDFLHHLVEDGRIEWERINAFHMDEYIGLPSTAFQSFGNFLRRRIFNRVPFKSVNYIDGMAPDIEKECARYAALLTEYPPDIVCLGIGENGHIAFNDPGVADFNDPELVKTVELDKVCRQQQVNEGCFKSLDMVPQMAITLTIPALLSADRLFCVVPFTNKAEAAYNTLYGEISESCPASILRKKDNSCLYLDYDSSLLIK